ncbi:Uridine kinase [Pseudocyphellaria aurata]|nr:Uridine kinase [Pseudocyphellaria aurata]
MEGAHYSPPWANTTIIGIAGGSGSGKTSLAVEIISALNVPWVVILSMDSFYKILTPEQHRLAHKNEYDLDAPSAIDFDLLVQSLRDLKQGRRVEIPIYSFEDHQRVEATTPIYSPHVLVLEGILALYDPRILELLDMKMFAEADADLCLARRITRDVRERGRDIEGCIKQWISFVKPNFHRYVEPQRNHAGTWIWLLAKRGPEDANAGHADIIIPRGIENRVAIDMVVEHVRRVLDEKSTKHQEDLQKLGKQVEDEPLSSNVLLLQQTKQVVAMSTIIQDPMTDDVDFLFYFDRLSTLLVEKAMDNIHFTAVTIETPQECTYDGLTSCGEVSAVVILRAGSCFETGLKRVIPDCRTGRVLIQTNYRTGEPELHYQKLPTDISSHDSVLLLDPQMSSGGAALMAVKVLVDHGVAEEKIVFVTYFAGKLGVNRLLKVFPKMKVVVCTIVEDLQERWIEKRYFRC